MPEKQTRHRFAPEKQSSIVKRRLLEGNVVAGRWAVWHHGYFGRMTQDIDISLAKDQVDLFLRAAAVSGFEILPQQQGRWLIRNHKETGVQVDILLDGSRPGTSQKLAPTTIPNPKVM